MKTTLVALSFFCVFFTLNAQKAKIKFEGDTAYVSGTPQFVVKSENLGNIFKVFSLKGSLLMSFVYQRYNHPSKISDANKDGSEVWIEVTFLGTGNKCEIQPLGMGSKMIARQIVDNHLIADDAVVAENESVYVTIFGTRFSQERNALFGNNGGNGTINININTR